MVARFLREEDMRREPLPNVPVKLLVDTSVWLDIASDYGNRHMLHTIETMVGVGDLILVVPRLVIEEFARNKDRLVRDSGHSLAAAVRRARDAAQRFGGTRHRRVVGEELNEIERNIVNFGDKIAEVVTRVEKLINEGEIVETSDILKLRAAESAIEKRAPCHRPRNGIADAIIVEIYKELVANRRKEEYFGFVTHNTRDFSLPNGDNRFPHSDLKAVFPDHNSQYFITMLDALKAYFAQDIWDLTEESQLFETPPRKLKEILEVEDELTTKIWYDRHQSRAQHIRAGHIKLVAKDEGKALGEGSRPIQRDIWEGALKAARKAEKKYGKKNLGPWDAFEWGMLNGKLSALRWVLGYEWDMLDT
jgi:hypothetical protein